MAVVFRCRPAKRLQRLPVEFFITQHAVFNNMLTQKYRFDILVLEEIKFLVPQASLALLLQ
jgi:hypothetical protein